MAGVEHFYASKLLYKRYAWKIKLELTVDGPEKTNPVKRFKAYFSETQRTEFLRPHYSWLNSNIGVKKYKMLVSWRRKTIRTLTKKGKRDLRTSKIVHVCQLLIYIADKATYEKTLARYNQYVIETTAPANDTHAELIQQGNTIEVRDKLFYNEYRYKIAFHRAWRHEVVAEITKAISSNLHDESKAEQQYYTTHSNATLYLKDRGDFIAMRIALSDHIKQIVVVSLPSELEPT